MGRLGLAKQLLTGVRGLFIDIFPEIATDEASFTSQLVPKFFHVARPEQAPLRTCRRQMLKLEYALAI